MTFEMILRLLRPLKQQIANMLGRGSVQSVDDSSKIQTVELNVSDAELGETREAERFQNYGFTSVPQDGAEALVLFVGGRRDHPVAVAVDDRRYRVKDLQAGEVAIYTDQGDKIVIKRGGVIEITASSQIKLNGGGTAITPVAKEGSAVTGSAGPFPVVANVQVGTGSQNVKVP